MPKPNNSAKKENIKKDVQLENNTQEIDMKILIQQVTQEISEKLKTEYESKILDLENKLNEKPIETIKVENNSKINKNKYKFIPDHTKIRLKSNIGGLFTFSEDRGKVRVFFQIDNFGQSATISFKVCVLDDILKSLLDEVLAEAVKARRART